MAKCERCGKLFDEWETAVAFESGDFASLPVHYDRFGRPLCYACATREYQNGNYFETCECCEKRFHPENENFVFESNLMIRKLNFNMYDFGILCADCAKNCILSGKEYEKLRQIGIHHTTKNDSQP